MRRRLPDVAGLLPTELIDPALWPQCPRYDGGTQPCSCWWAQRQNEYLVAGGEWPGGESREMTDLLAVICGPFECREPFDGSGI